MLHRWLHCSKNGLHYIENSGERLKQYKNGLHYVGEKALTVRNYQGLSLDATV